MAGNGDQLGCGWWKIFCSVAALISVATAVRFGIMEAAQKEKARAINCASHLKNFALCSRMYSGDQGEWFPSRLELLVEKSYFGGDDFCKLIVCPSVRAGPVVSMDKFSWAKHSDYEYFGGGINESCGGYDPAKTILGCDRKGNHRGFLNVWFADGHVTGYRGSTIEDIADRNGLFLPGHNMPAKESATAEVSPSR